MSPTGVTHGAVVRAFRMNQGGRVVIACTAQADGSLSDCDVESENPEGYGFADAAFRFIHKFTLRRDLGPDDPQVGEEVNLPLVFSPAKD